MENIEKISVDGYYVWVDKDAEIKVGDIVLEDLINGNYLIMTIHTLNDIDTEIQAKIMAASPELKLKRIPTYEALRALEYAKPYVKDIKDDEDYAWHGGLIQGFKEGFNTAQKELFTEEDMRNAWGNGAMSDHGSISSFEKFIEQIKQSKK